MQDKIVPMLLGDSQYATRLPIGDMEIIRNAPVDALRSFYEKWYRPDLMAVIAVGDFCDVCDKTEALIRERFSKLPQADGKTVRARRSMSPAGGRARVCSSSKILRTPTLRCRSTRFAASRSLETVGEYRDLLLDYLVSMMLNQRYAELAQQADAPFLQAEAGNDSLVRPTDILASLLW